jgi:hypothetical protein
MTESEWLTSTKIAPMLWHLHIEHVFLAGPSQGLCRTKEATRISDRKFRLFVAACCRQVWRELSDPRSRKAVEVGELYADGLVKVEAGEWIRDAWRAHREKSGPDGYVWTTALAHDCLVHLDNLHAWRVWESVDPLDQIDQVWLLRDLVGNPFRPVTLPTGDGYQPCPWLTPTAISLAQAAYDERALPSGQLDPLRLSVLADALEEEGCPGRVPCGCGGQPMYDNIECKRTAGKYCIPHPILGHLRSAGPHVRGCWAVDLVLGKE